MKRGDVVGGKQGNTETTQIIVGSRTPTLPQVIIYVFSRVVVIVDGAEPSKLTLLFKIVVPVVQYNPTMGFKFNFPDSGKK